tara:strand:+ start:9275 stop:9442 length:168 start_codon:yes stop_codon:yes gene_type:complete
MIHLINPYPARKLTQKKLMPCCCQSPAEVPAEEIVRVSQSHSADGMTNTWVTNTG